MAEKLVRCPLSFSPVTYPKDCFSKRSYPVAATDAVGAGFILTIPDAEEIAIAAVVEEVRVECQECCC